MLWLSLLAWGFLFWYAHNHPVKEISFPERGGGGGGDEAPTVPSYQLPSWAESLPPEIKQYIMQGVGQTVSMPTEYGISSDALQKLLGYTPEQFQYPMADIQKALEAQQGLQYEQYLKQIRPTMAQQGQLDSTYYANMISDYLKNQQAQGLTNTANLLTNQATQNYNLSTWLPQFQSGVAGQLAGIGGQKAQIDQYNLQYPYQTYIPALTSLYGQGVNQGNAQYQSAMNQYNAAMQDWQNQQNQAGAQAGSIGSLSGMGLALALAPFTGGASLAFIPAASSLGGTVGSMFAPSSSQSSTSQQLDLSGLTSSLYKPNWNIPYGATSYGGGSWGSSTPYYP
jgi:hypothetical protein